MQNFGPPEKSGPSTWGIPWTPLSTLLFQGADIVKINSIVTAKNANIFLVVNIEV